jgi:hypothetical protein
MGSDVDPFSFRRFYILIPVCTKSYSLTTTSYQELRQFVVGRLRGADPVWAAVKIPQQNGKLAMLEIAYHHQWKLFELVVEG